MPVVRFGSHHKKREGEETMKAELMEDDDFGLAAVLQLCVGARVILTRNMWIGAGLVNGSMGTVVNFVWEPGGDPASSDPRLRAPLCIIVEFDDVQLDETAVDGDGKPYVVNRRRYFEDVDGEDRSRWVPIFHAEGESKTDKNVSWMQLPLVLAWALTHWKAQGMTLRRVRICMRRAVAGVPLASATSRRRA